MKIILVMEVQNTCRFASSIIWPLVSQPNYRTLSKSGTPFEESEMIFRGLWVLAWLRGSLGDLVYLQMFVIEQALWRGWESVVLRENNFGAGFFKTLSDFKMSGVVTTQFPADDTRHGVVYFWPAENITYTVSFPRTLRNLNSFL